MGVGGAQNWKADKKYKANSLVYTNEKLYICMEDHTSGTDFATDLLSGKWKFIGNGVGSNVSQTQLLSSPLTTTGADVTATLSDDINNYDYAILTFSPTVSGIRKSEVIKVNGTTNSFVCLMEYMTKGNELHYAQVSGAISNSDITIRNRNADVTWASIDLESVIGIKIQELTTDYIAKLAMPSDVMEQHIINIKNTSWGIEISDFSAPEDGYVSITGNLVASSFNVSKQIFFGKIINGEFLATNWFQIAANGVQNNGGIGGYYEVKKGERVTVRSNGIGIFVNNNVTVRFFYSVGSAKALGLI